MNRNTVIALMILVFIGGYTLAQLTSREKPDSETALMPAAMDLQTLDTIIQANAEVIEATGNYWAFKIGQINMACIADPANDRMRIIAPIIDTANITEDHRRTMLDANFHSALDARYATSKVYYIQLLSIPFLH